MIFSPFNEVLQLYIHGMANRTGSNYYFVEDLAVVRRWDKSRKTGKNGLNEVFKILISRNWKTIYSDMVIIPIFFRNLSAFIS